MTKSKTQKLRRKLTKNGKAKSLRRTLWLQQNYRCKYCGKETILMNQDEALSLGICNKIATLEHKVPLSKGGSNKLRNLVVACYECNWKRDQIVRGLI